MPPHYRTIVSSVPHVAQTSGFLLLRQPFRIRPSCRSECTCRTRRAHFLKLISSSTTIQHHGKLQRFRGIKQRRTTQRTNYGVCIHLLDPNRICKASTPPQGKPGTPGTLLFTTKLLCVEHRTHTGPGRPRRGRENRVRDCSHGVHFGIEGVRANQGFSC